MQQRKSVKRYFPILLGVGLVFVMMTATAQAGGWGQCGGGRGGMNANLTPEQSAQVFDLRQKFMNDTAGLRKQMFEKRAELAALGRSGNPDQQQLQSKQQELNVLRGQMKEKATAFQSELQQKVPGAKVGRMAFAGRGKGNGRGMGNGSGAGCGMMDRGL